MTNKEFVKDHLERDRGSGRKKEKLFTEEERKHIKEKLKEWEQADEELDTEVASGFLKESIKELIKKNSEEKKSPSRKGNLKEIEIVENCILKDGSKSYKIVIYLTDKKTLEEAVDDYQENFKEERVVEVVKNFEGKEVKSEVSSASGTLDND